MLPILAIGAVGGIMWGALGPGAPSQPEESPAEHTQQPQHAGLPEPLPEHPPSNQQQARKFVSSRVAAVIGGIACLSAAAAVSLIRRQRHRHGRGKHSKTEERQRKDGRIPLKDLVRFKERMWFVEELENARDGDPNSMLRLAKMYLHGQGCQQNIAMAQEWVRKARAMGVPGTLDELYATDDPDPRTKLRSLAALEERRRSLRRLTAGGAGHRHSGAPHQTAAA